MAGDQETQKSVKEDHERVARIEAKLGVPIGYYESLEEEVSDWEFSIKLLVLLEAALGSVIAAKLQNPVIRDHCERLNLNGRTGKIQLAESLEILKSEEAAALRALADIRNAFAHRVENISSTLDEFAKRIGTAKLSEYCRRVMMIPQDLQNNYDDLWAADEMPSLFRFVLWKAGYLLLWTIADHDMHAEAEAERRRRFERILNAPNATRNMKLADLLMTDHSTTTLTPVASVSLPRE